jgi:hypothetical protein
MYSSTYILLWQLILRKITGIVIVLKSLLIVWGTSAGNPCQGMESDRLWRATSASPQPLDNPKELSTLTTPPTTTVSLGLIGDEIFDHLQVLGSCKSIYKLSLTGGKSFRAGTRTPACRAETFSLPIFLCYNLTQFTRRKGSE